MAHEKILVDQDNELRDSILSDLAQFERPFAKVIETYDALNMGEMTNDVFEHIRNNRAGQIVKQYNGKLEEELDGAKIANPTLRARMLAGTEEPPKAFLKAVNEFINLVVKHYGYKRRDLGSEVQLTVDDISFKDGELYITDENAEAVTEKHCRFYLQTEEERRAFEAVEIISTQYRILMDIEKKLGMDLNRSSMNCIQGFFMDVGDQIKPNKRYIAGMSARMKRMNKYR